MGVPVCVCACACSFARTPGPAPTLVCTCTYLLHCEARFSRAPGLGTVRRGSSVVPGHLASLSFLSLPSRRFFSFILCAHVPSTGVCCVTLEVIRNRLSSDIKQGQTTFVDGRGRSPSVPALVVVVTTFQSKKALRLLQGDPGRQACISIRSLSWIDGNVNAL